MQVMSVHVKRDILTASCAISANKMWACGFCYKELGPMPQPRSSCDCGATVSVVTLLQGNSPVRIAHTNKIDYLGAMLKESADVILSTYDNAAVAKPQP